MNRILHHVLLMSSLIYAFCALRLATAYAILGEQPLRDFQVSEPVIVPEDSVSCTVLLTHHLFANSYGSPAILDYVVRELCSMIGTRTSSPKTNLPLDSGWVNIALFFMTQPTMDCGKPGTWANIVLNMTATSNGTQYDRSSTIYLSNVEIWRTSTPEPTALGIIWTALKDVSRYSPLFSKAGQMIVDLGNMVDVSAGLTGEYDVWLSATFYPSSVENPPAAAADFILPLSTLSTTQANLFVIPPSGSTNVTLPRNSAEAYVEIYASGNGDEEFWYGNVPDEYFDDLPTWSAPDGYASPHGPFREIQLLIDGTLAGVVFPYPVVYTGEFLPSIWRPMVSYGAFDSPTYYIDITPFLGLLCSGSPHNFTLNVAGMGAGLSINANWYVSGNVQVIVDISDEPTTGRLTVYDGVPYVEAAVHGEVSGGNVSVETGASRVLYVEGEVWTGSGHHTKATWVQNLTYSNSEVYATTLSNVSVQTVMQISSGLSLSTHNGAPVISDSFNYPFYLQLQYSAGPNSTFYDYDVNLDHSYQRNLAAGPTAGDLGQDISTRQICEGTQSSHEVNVTMRTGNTTEMFGYVDTKWRTYTRDVGVSTTVRTVSGSPSNNNSTVLYDNESGSLATPSTSGNAHFSCRRRIFM